jgi:hypothetical protein
VTTISDDESPISLSQYSRQDSNLQREFDFRDEFSGLTLSREFPTSARTAQIQEMNVFRFEFKSSRLDQS